MFGRMNEAGERITEPGIHHFRTDEHRIHIRIDTSGSGIMTVDASRIVHLNPVAADMGWMILSGFSKKRMMDSLIKRYRVNRKKAASDLDEFGTVLHKIIETGASEPVSYVNMEIYEPFQTPVEVPYRMDLALTYRCNLDCGHCYNRRAEKEELSTEQWKRVMNSIWDLGIPHVIFTGGEATLREDLPELIDHAERLGMVTGLLTNGVRLRDMEYLETLLKAGLDHVQVTLESADREIHNSMTGSDSFEDTVLGIRNCIESGLHTVTNTTITRDNFEGITDTIEFASGLGLRAVAANAVISSGRALEGDYGLPPDRLEPVILAINEKADELGMRFIWYSPTRYCSLNPLELDLGAKRCTAGEYNLCVEPDGEVLPCQSWYESAGNILKDTWESIWNSELLKGCRNREWIEEACTDCVHFTLCGGGCPLEKRNGPPCRDSQ